jgi:hypothetical protein
VHRSRVMTRLKKVLASRAVPHMRKKLELTPTGNHKRVFRIMERQGFLLQRYSGRRKGPLPDGKGVVMRSNLRWCSDVFEITCWNGDIVSRLRH